MAKFAVNETTRQVIFKDGSGIEIQGVREVDNSGTYLRLTTADTYFLINPDDVRMHVIAAEEKVA